MKGTENLFAFILVACVLGVQVEKALADDGKISGLKEIYAVGSSAIAKIPVLVEVAPEAFAEAKDLTVLETVDLIKRAKNEQLFLGDYSHSQVTKWVEASLDLLQVLAKFANNGDTEPFQLGNAYAALHSIQMSEKQ